MSVDPSGVGRILVYGVMTAVSVQAGSVAGGTPITLTLSGAVWNASVLSNNRITVGGAPCIATAVVGAGLTCTSSSVQGLVQAEYWNLPPNSWSAFPNVEDYVAPGASSGANMRANLV